MRLVAVVAILLLAEPALAQKNTVLLEGFEQFTKTTKAAAGEFKIIEGPPGVTQGRQALNLKTGASVTIAISVEDFGKLEWLKVDTYVDEKGVPTRLRFFFEAKDFGAYMHGVCAPGQDTLALPLSAALSQTGRKEWPGEGLKLTLLNLGPTPVTVDNVRLEAADAPPPGAVMVDLGPEHALHCWPGFSCFSPVLTWAKDQQTNHPSGTGLPDPLMGTSLAPWIQLHATSTVILESKGPGDAWLWFSHYGINYSQAPEASMKMRGKFLWNRRLTLRQLLGPQGMQEGMDGDWTPQWLDKTYAAHLVECVQAPLTPGRNAVEMVNCQLVTIAMGGTSNKEAINNYVKKVKKDLTTYRRQFVLGLKVECISKLTPTDEEIKAGAMLFWAPRGVSTDPAWTPTEDSRLKTLKVTVYNGGIAMVPLVVVPLKKALLTASFGSIRSTDGKSLGAGVAQAPELWFMQRVPYLAEGQSSMMPWVLAHRMAAREREVVHAAVVITVPLNATAGDYSGGVRITAGSGQISVPLEVRVLRCGGEPAGPPPTFGTFGSDLAGGLYGSMGAMMEGPVLDKMLAKLRAELLAMGFNALTLPGSTISVSGAVAKAADYPCTGAIKSLQGKGFKGRPIVELGSAVSNLAYAEKTSGKALPKSALADAVAHSVSIITKAGLSEPLVYATAASIEDELDDVMPALQDLSGSPRLAMMLYDYLVVSLSQEKFLKLTKSLSVLLVNVNGSAYMGKVDEFIKAGSDDRELYLVLRQCEEYGMGFYAWGQGAKGWYLQSVFDGRLYCGAPLTYRGVLASDVDPAQPTIPLQSYLWMRQGISDFNLAMRAQAMVKEATKAGLDSEQVEKILKDLRKQAREPLGYYGPRGEDLDKQRLALMEALADLAGQLKSK